MKRILFLWGVLLSCSAFSQHDVMGSVIDATTNVEIVNAKILDVFSKNETFSNSLGQFSIKTQGQLEISVEGYITKTIIVSKDGKLVIALSPSINELEEVFINGLTIPVKQKYAIDNISLISKEDLDRGNGMELRPILNRVSGVHMQTGALNTNKITIRGIGARSLFGTSNIRAYFGDIPLTDGNGESAIEDLELGSVSRIEIHKGPSSSTYGVGLGGTILLLPEYADYTSKKVTVSSVIGSYGLRRFVAKASVGGKKSATNIIYGNSHSNGYRMNNEYNRYNITVTSNIYGGEKDKFSILGSYVNLKSGIPSSLNQDRFDNNPRQAAFTWGRSKGYEDVDYGIMGVTWKHYYNNNLSQQTSVFSSLRGNYEPRPFNILKESSNSFGIRSRVLGVFKVLEKELNWTFGSELFFDNYNAKTFENLYQDYPEGTGSVKGDQLSNLDEDRNYYNFFVEANFRANEKLKFNMGVNLNRTLFKIKDRFLSDGEDSSGRYNFKFIISPKIGFNYLLNPNVVMFGNISHGFSTPTTSETLLPEGTFNPNIKPEIGWNYEIGTRLNLLDNKFKASLSVYTLKVKDLLVSRRTTEDNFFAINAGKTNHNGIETEINYTILGTDQIKFITTLNATLNTFKFKEFVDFEDDYSGNRLTGAPSHVINFGMDLVSDTGVYGNINFQGVGKIPANDANTVFGNSYEILFGKIGFKNNIGKNFSYDLFLGMNNILNTKYASQLQVNATGFGGSMPRYFYPGLPFNVYGGINFTYSIF
ncbi:TonB-dependent receptor domain-containing protein [Aestuariivivens insulae]|uniref:TonB-dependent receptor domain-containing protein n=1 Tax=Aestuariivivens insulae TaxID=1621988 RepID=UPI001F5A2F0D|nr:TonB-dependent receptor [Aestuariivivens insulae]